MSTNALVCYVAEYICRIVGNNSHESCPFASFEEATKAYLLHKERINNRFYNTVCDEWRRNYEELRWSKGYPRKRLRTRRDVK